MQPVRAGFAEPRDLCYTAVAGWGSTPPRRDGLAGSRDLRVTRWTPLHYRSWNPDLQGYGALVRARPQGVAQF